MRLGFMRPWEISFGKAIVLSSLWHFFWMSSVTIVHLPTKVAYPRFADVSFLGSLLDEPNFEVHVTERPLLRGVPKLSKRELMRAGVRGFFDEEVSVLSGADVPDAAKRWGIPGAFLGLRKKNPGFSPGEKLPHAETVVLEGPVASRALYYRPPFPTLPKWIDPQEGGAHLKLRFWVSAEGRIAEIEKETSSGDPTVDMIGMRYLRQWQFNPKATESEEWGTVLLRFPLSPEGP